MFVVARLFKGGGISGLALFGTLQKTRSSMLISWSCCNPNWKADTQSSKALASSSSWEVQVIAWFLAELAL